MTTEAANKAFSAYVGLDKPEKKSKAKAQAETPAEPEADSTDE